jgi:hypothetical protein
LPKGDYTTLFLRKQAAFQLSNANTDYINSVSTA